MMFRTVRFLAFLLFFALPLVVSSQSKPKRDTTKDKSAVIARQKQEQAKQKAAEQAAAEKKRNEIAAAPKRRSKTVKKAAPKLASYLIVDNNTTSLIKSYDAQRGSERFIVQTDGQDWNISFLPSWCQVTTKDSDYFILSYSENDSHDERSDWFSVKCDSKEVRVIVQQAGAPINIVSQIDRVNLIHNYLSANRSYMKIEADVSIQGAKQQLCYIVATFQDQNGPIKAAPGYADFAMNSAGDLYVYTQVYPQTDTRQNYNISMLLPNDAMLLYKKKIKDLVCKVSVYCASTSSYVSPSIPKLFSAKLKKKKVTTSY